MELVREAEARSVSDNPIRTYWPIATVVAAGFVTWGVYQAKLSANEANDVKVETRVNQIERDIGAIRQSLAKIETTQTFSAAELERMRQEQGRLTDALNQLLRELREAR